MPKQKKTGSANTVEIHGFCALCGRHVVYICQTTSSGNLVGAPFEHPPVCNKCRQEAVDFLAELIPAAWEDDHAAH